MHKIALTSTQEHMFTFLPSAPNVILIFSILSLSLYVGVGGARVGEGREWVGSGDTILV